MRRIDPAIAALDALIAFALDITNGTLYFRSGRQSSVSTGTEPIRVIRVNPVELNKDKIEEILDKYAGISGTLDFGLDFGEVRFCELNKSGNIGVELVELKNSWHLGD
jgi:hypothetical protein